MKDVLDKFMKNQLQKMSGAVEDTRWTFTELRKFPLMNIEAPNFESVTLEKLKAQPTDKPIKL